MRVIVFGASGVQGAAQVKALVEAGHHPIAVSRHPKPLEIAGHQVETFAADFSDAAAIARVMQLGEVVFLTLPSTSFQPSRPIIEAAKTIGAAASSSPGVRLLVFNTSMPVPDETKDIKAQDDRREMRAILRATGLPVISIQPVCYLDNLLEGWAYPPLIADSKIVYCHQPTLDVAWICHDDVARFMVSAMSRPHLAGRNFRVAGPETVRLPVLTEKLSRGWGRPLTWESQTVEDFCEKIKEAMRSRSGLDPEKVVSQMFKAYTYYRGSDEFNPEMGRTMEELPAERTGIEEWARAHPLPAKA